MTIWHAKAIFLTGSSPIIILGLCPVHTNHQDHAFLTVWKWVWWYCFQIEMKKCCWQKHWLWRLVWTRLWGLHIHPWTVDLPILTVDLPILTVYLPILTVDLPILTVDLPRPILTVDLPILTVDLPILTVDLSIFDALWCSHLYAWVVTTDDIGIVWTGVKWWLTTTDDWFVLLAW